MAQAIQMPKFGQATEEGTIVRWLKKVGDTVAKGDILFETETDKSVMEVESFHEGTLLKIIVPDGGTAPVNSTVAFLGQPGEAVPDVVAAPAAPKPAEAAPKTQAAPQATRTAAVPSAAPQAAVPAAPAVAAGPAKPFAISPRAKKRAQTAVIDPMRINGTGPDGRVVEKDVEAYLEQHNYSALRITPAAKVLAARESLDVLALDGSGDGGKILVADVELALAEKPKTMSKMRQVIAQRLTQSFTSVPHFFVTVAADLTDLLAFREQLKDRGEKYSVTDFVMEAVVLSLVEFPVVNSSTDGKAVWWHSRVHLGVAVALEQGLVVPVVRKADLLSMAELRDAAKGLVGKARDGKMAPDEMQGSTFTISNMGMMNVENFTAIINPGESAILAVSSTFETPVVRDGKIVPRHIMKFTLSSDHRIIDGATAAQFANSIKNKLEDMELWKRLT